MTWLDEQYSHHQQWHCIVSFSAVLYHHNVQPVSSTMSEQEAKKHHAATQAKSMAKMEASIRALPPHQQLII